MLEAIFSGVVLGLVLSLLIGPVFFMLLNTSIRKGFKAASYLAIGVLISDFVYVIIAYFGSSLLLTMQKHQNLVGIIGGVILIVFGIINMFKKPILNDNNNDLNNKSKLTNWIAMSKGFMMNALNPFVLIFWLGVSSTITIKFKSEDMLILIFFSSALGMIFITDLLKSFLAIKLKSIISEQFLIGLNRISGLCLLVYGVRMLIKLYFQ